MTEFKQRKRPKLGDVVEVPIPGRGNAYVQYVNHHREPPKLGHLIRVLPGIFEARPDPDSLRKLVTKKERFFAFFPLGAACHQGHTTIVANEPIPLWARDWPLFKAYNENFNTGERTWWLWDGNESKEIGDLPKRYYDLPLEEVIDLKVLEDRIASGWTPRDEAD